jgi:hypothetical protein
MVPPYMFSERSDKSLHIFAYNQLNLVYYFLTTCFLSTVRRSSVKFSSELCGDYGSKKNKLKN